MSKEEQQQPYYINRRSGGYGGRNDERTFQNSRGGEKADGDVNVRLRKRNKNKKEVLEIAYNKRLREFCRQPCYRNESTYVQCRICRY